MLAEARVRPMNGYEGYYWDLETRYFFPRRSRTSGGSYVTGSFGGG